MRCFRHRLCGQNAEYKWRVGNVFYVACKVCMLALKAKTEGDSSAETPRKYYWPDPKKEV